MASTPTRSDLRADRRPPSESWRKGYSMSGWNSDDLLSGEHPRLHVIGAKVKQARANRNRFVAYAEDDTIHWSLPCVKRLSTEPGKKAARQDWPKQATTAEIQRLAQPLAQSRSRHHCYVAQAISGADPLCRPTAMLRRGPAIEAPQTRRHTAIALHQARRTRLLRPVRIQRRICRSDVSPEPSSAIPALSRIEMR